jgi:hypothetical protein
MQIAFSVSLGVDKSGQKGDKKIHYTAKVTFVSSLNYV